MKMIETLVRSHRLGAAEGAPDTPSADGKTSQRSQRRRRSRQDLKIEVVVSDTQAKQIIDALLETGKLAYEADSFVDELIVQELRAAGLDANDLRDRVLGRVERELIRRVLHECEGVQTRAAARLGINRNTLHKLCRKYDL